MPPSLQFDLRPRVARSTLRIALAALMVGAAVALVLWFAPRQAELARLRAATQAAAVPTALAVSAPARLTPWQAAADQDEALFSLPLEPRLLEIERCTDAKTVVTRIVHDASARSTSPELSTPEPEAVRALLECLNQSVQGQPVWRLLSVEAQLSGPAGAAAGQRVVLRYP